MNPRLLCLLALVGCKNSPTDDTGSSSSPWAIVADGFSPGALLSIWASSEEEVLFVGGGLRGAGPGVLARYRPADQTLCWETLLEDKALWWIHGLSATDWYAVGEKGSILHYTKNDGITDESVATDATFYGVWASEDAVWAVGGFIGGSPTGSGEIWKKDESGWALVADSLPGTVFKVWDGHFVGTHVAYRLNADGLLEEIPPGTHKLLTLRGRSHDDIWAVGGLQAASVMHFDGVEWNSIQTAGLSLPLMGVWTAPGESVWVSGMNGVQAYSQDNGENWVIPDFPLTSSSFHAVMAHGDEVLFAGGNLMTSGDDYYATIGRFSHNHKPVSASNCSE